MKKINFLSKLSKEGKLRVVQPSEEIKESYIRKSKNSLESAKILLDNGKLEESITLSYYSMYHLLNALLFKVGIKCENHSGAIILMKELFEMDNLGIAKAKSDRIDKQYYTDFRVTRDEAINAIKEAENFDAMLFDFISKLSNNEIKVFIKKFEKILLGNAQ